MRREHHASGYLNSLDMAKSRKREELLLGTELQQLFLLDFVDIVGSLGTAPAMGAVAFNVRGIPSTTIRHPGHEQLCIRASVILRRAASGGCESGTCRASVAFYNTINTDDQLVGCNQV